MMYKERSSSNYLFFRFPSQYLLILIPFILGITGYFFETKSTDATNANVSSIIIENQYESISTFLSLSKLMFAIICAFFITYRWTVINKDGSYGYFLTQGVNRDKFFIRSAGVFYLNGILGIILGIFTLNYMGGMHLSMSTLFKIVLLTLSSTLLIISISVLLGEVLSLPELSSFIVILTFGLINNIDESENSFLFKVFRSEQLFTSNSILVPFVLSFGLGLILIIFAFFFHKKQEVEL